MAALGLGRGATANNVKQAWLGSKYNERNFNCYSFQRILVNVYHNSTRITSGTYRFKYSMRFVGIACVDLEFLMKIDDSFSATLMYFTTNLAAPDDYCLRREWQPLIGWLC